MTGNENQVNLLKICMEKFVKSHQVNLFLAGFSYLEPQCSAGEASESPQCRRRPKCVERSGIGANVGGKWRREVPAPCLFSSLILQRFLFIQCLSATYEMQTECLS